MKNEDLITDSIVEKLVARFQGSILQITLEIFCNEYKEFVKRNRAAKTYIGVCLVCNKLLSYFSPIKIIETIRLKDAEDFIHELKKTAPKAFYNYHRTLRAMFNKGIEWNYLRENVFAKIKLPKRQDSKPTFVTEINVMGNN